MEDFDIISDLIIILLYVHIFMVLMHMYVYVLYYTVCSPLTIILRINCEAFVNHFVLKHMFMLHLNCIVHSNNISFESLTVV